MKRIACFCIPAHGHMRPMLPVVAELVRRGNAVRFYTFDAFAGAVRATGAEYVACDGFLPELDARERAALERVSATEMMLQDIAITRAMDDMLAREFAKFRPDVVFTDSVCFWGKLNAQKHGVPMVVSSSTMAFNQLSSGYMKHSPGEMADVLGGMGRVSRELKQLRRLGYRTKGPLALVSSDNSTDTVVYTSRKFQPYSASFSSRYAFVGPVLPKEMEPDKQKGRPLVYVALGTVINDRPEFYRACAEALGGMDVDAVISCGSEAGVRALGELPGNVRAYPRVNQIEVLARADAFITHCGMNSASESLYMATPMALYPQTGEQRAVARRIGELGAGVALRDDGARGIRRAVEELLGDARYARAAAKCSADFRACAGAAGAAEFIEGAPHAAATDPLARFNLVNGAFQLAYWAGAIAAIAAVSGQHGHAWALGLAAGGVSALVGRPVQELIYRKLVDRGMADRGKAG